VTASRTSKMPAEAPRAARSALETPGGQLTNLRGAGVDVDVRRLGQVFVGLFLVALIALTVVFAIVGINKNAQINRLRQHGVSVQVTVTGCLGLLGGSGSNAAGYACRGTFVFGAHRYHEAIPGDSLYPSGTMIRAVIDPNDPALLDTPGTVAAAHASWRVFLLPIIFAVAALGTATLSIRSRRQNSSPPTASSASGVGEASSTRQGG
jgi:hypothetical protein